MKIQLKENQKVYFTSDTHYNHSNICKGTTKWLSGHFRDFDTLEEMNDTLVRNINSTVGEDDILVHLGDWSFGGFESISEFRNRITCKNIIIFTGNHDHHIEKNRNSIKDLFMGVAKYGILTLVYPFKKGEKRVSNSFVCFHHPIASWDGMNNGIIHLHGHTHLSRESRMGEGKHIDVGVEGNNLYPYELSEILSLMENKPVRNLKLPYDHHADEKIIRET